MAFSAVTALGTAGVETGAGNCVITLGANAEAGRLVFVLIGKDNVNNNQSYFEITSVTDSAGGNVWYSALRKSSAHAANAGAYVDIWFSVLTNQINSGGTITITKSTDVDCAATAYKVTKGAGTRISVDGYNSSQVSAAAPGSLATSGMVSREHLHVRAIAAESETTTGPTATASWTAINGTISTTAGGAAANMRVAGEYRITTSTGETSNPTLFSADAASVLVAFYEISTSVDEVLLLHLNGSDGSTTFTDSSPDVHTVTRTGSAEIDTAQSKFSGASLLNNGGYLNLDGSSQFTLAGDFTVDLWVRWNTTTALSFLWTTGDSECIMIHNFSNVIRTYSHSVDSIIGTTALTADVWHHVALTRSGNSTRLFLNGVQEGSTLTDYAVHLVAANFPRLGAHVAGGSIHNGWLDEYRVRNGTATWTANFTPPTDEYGAPVQQTLEARFNGSGNLSAGTRARSQVQARLPGVGDLAARVNMRARILARFAGAGNIAFDAAKVTAGQHSGEARYAGAGTLAVDAAVPSAVATTAADFTIPVIFQYTLLYTSLVEPVFLAAVAHSGEARFAGVGNLSARAQLSIPVTARFAGTGNLSARTQLSIPIAATFAGSGNLSARALLHARIEAQFAGTGSLTANVRQSHRVLALFAGTGNLAAAVDRFTFVQVTLAGEGSLAALAVLHQRVTARLAGEGALSVQATQVQSALATLDGVGSLAARATLTQAVEARFAGTGDFAAEATIGAEAHSGEATFDGAGLLSAAAVLQQRALATFAGSGSLTAAFTQGMAARVTFAGVGSLSAFASLRMSIQARLDGAGSFSIATRQVLAAQALFAGSGSLAAEAATAAAHVGEATFAGLGSLSVQARLQQLAYATLAGTGSLSALGSLQLGAAAIFGGTGALAVEVTKGVITVEATLAGAGSLSARASLRGAIAARFDGTGALTATARLVMPAAARFAGAGNLSAQISSTFAAEARFSGFGGLSATVTQQMATAALLAGQGDLAALATLSQSIAAILNGTGELSADTTAISLLLPDADDIDGTWTNELGGDELFSHIDEPTADDADYIQSAIDPVNDLCKISLSNPGSVPTQPVNVLYRYRKTGPQQIDLRVRLLQGVTEIGSWDHTNIGEGFVDGSQTLSGPQFAAITDFDDLFIEFRANKP